jgi:hypothetical protein
VGKFVDLTGQRFGRLTVLYRKDIFKKSGKKETAYMCKCDCGTERCIVAYNLKNGHTVSCGCQSLENRTKARTTHHLTGTRIYRIWRGMKTRCENKNDYHYEWYGARGIKVCEEWQTFEPFYDWAMANGYKENLALDRIDNDGDYEPSNCRWATQKEQSNNTRRNRQIVHNGVSHTLAEWADIANIRPITLAYRIKSGWDMDKALNTPVRRSVNGHYSP